jgi:hypothetical protein
MFTPPRYAARDGAQPPVDLGESGHARRPHRVREPAGQLGQALRDRVLAVIRASAICRMAMRDCGKEDDQLIIVTAQEAP